MRLLSSKSGVQAIRTRHASVAKTRAGAGEAGGCVPTGAKTTGCTSRLPEAGVSESLRGDGVRCDRDLFHPKGQTGPSAVFITGSCPRKWTAPGYKSQWPWLISRESK